MFRQPHEAMETAQLLRVIQHRCNSGWRRFAAAAAGPTATRVHRPTLAVVCARWSVRGSFPAVCSLTVLSYCRNNSFTAYELQHNTSSIFWICSSGCSYNLRKCSSTTQRRNNLRQWRGATCCRQANAHRKDRRRPTLRCANVSPASPVSTTVTGSLHEPSPQTCRSSERRRSIKDSLLERTRTTCSQLSASSFR